LEDSDGINVTVDGETAKGEENVAGDVQNNS